MTPLTLTICLPLFGAFIIAALPAKYKSRLSVFVLGLTFLASIFCLFAVFNKEQLSFRQAVNDWFSLSFFADGLGVFMASVSSFVAFLISIYSLEYMQDYPQKNDFYFWMVLFVGSMMGLIFSANLLLIYCFWEITAVCSWRLIGFYRREKDTKAADRAFLTTFFGASLLLAGIILIFINQGTLDLNLLERKTLFNWAAFLLLAGIIAKSAQLPLQTWLPEAGVAPTPVTALLHAAVLVKIGVFIFARLFKTTFVVSQSFFDITVFISTATIIVGGAGALVENNMKRILAYSTISQLGYIILAFSLTDNLAFTFGLLYILAHSLAKAGLFLCAGIVEHKTGTKNINELGGLLKQMPVCATAYLACAFSIIGLAPFLGFWPKLGIIWLTIKEGRLVAASFAVIGALFTMFYLMRLFNKVFLGEVKIQAQEGKNSLMVYTVAILGALSLLFGLVVKLPLNLISGLLR